MILRLFDYVIFKPIMLLMEVLLNILLEFHWPDSFTLLIFSLLINLLILPIYICSDISQIVADSKEQSLKDNVNHINKTFRGEERLYILNILYKQNGYQFGNIVRSGIPLILELILFVCSYRFLAFNSDFFNNNSLHNIFDISISLFGCNIYLKLLPIIMTMISLISNKIYCKYILKRTDIKLDIVSIFFLIVIYNSPTVLVLYYIYNNIFYLIKNILLVRTTNRIAVTTSVNNIVSLRKKDIIDFVILVLVNMIFFSLFVPLRFIYSSVNEFFLYYKDIRIGLFLGQIFLLCFGIFGFWGSIVYFMQSSKGKSLFLKIFTVLFFVLLINYIFFTSTGTLFNVELSIQKYNSIPFYINIIKIALLIIVSLIIVYRKHIVPVNSIIIIISISLLVTSFVYIKKIYPFIFNPQVSSGIRNEEETKKFKLSTNGKNVILIMFDSAREWNIPYIFQEKPELKEVYSGFRYYSNIISFGDWTGIAFPVVLGGYEYTPIEMNKRKDEYIMDKLMEACSVLPSIFKSNGFNTMIYDMNKANVAHSLLNGLELESIKIKTSIDLEYFTKKFFMFSFTISLPSILHELFYANGSYNCSYDTQHPMSYYEATGKPGNYINEYNSLSALSSICEITNDMENNYMSIFNNITHAPFTLLQTPNYTIENNVDNSEYYIKNKDKFYYKNNYLFMDKNTCDNSHNYSGSYMYSYNSNMGAILCFSDFIRYLKANNVYDNTRIIIVSDHASIYKIRGIHYDEYPLLMIKDFNAKGFYEDESFMTNADVPCLALNELVVNPINPFTGKIINDFEKTSHKQYIYISNSYAIGEDEKVFRPNSWLSVHTNVYDVNNWQYTEGKYVLDKYEFPKEDVHELKDIKDY